MAEPVELVMSDNKIYSTIYSEDRQRIMIFKVQTRQQKFDMKTMLFDTDMNKITEGRYVADYNERKENYDNFQMGNDGSFVFTHARQSGNRDNSNGLGLYRKDPLRDSFNFREIDLKEKYIDEVKLKIDNRNQRYIINTFYYKKNRVVSRAYLSGYGINRPKNRLFRSFTEIYDSLRYEAKSDGMLRLLWIIFYTADHR
ncbi:MAG: hypothetical protein IPL84_03695 [Chitinophagaceae bacterium]|nr:hypothetical protein [Chitinophagaceae bacterium]